MSCAKTDEPIQMPFGVWTRVDQVGAQIPSRVRRNIGGAPSLPLRCDLSSKFIDHLLLSAVERRQQCILLLLSINVFTFYFFLFYTLVVGSVR